MEITRNTPALRGQSNNVKGICSVVLLMGVALSPALSRAQSAVSCDSLTKLELPQATLISAQTFAAGEFHPPAANGGGGPGGPGGPGGGPGGPGGGPGGPGGAGGPGGGGPGGGGQAAAPPVSLPAFCRVLLKLKPSSDSDINMEVWLPTSGWNGKFVGVGNFGTAGKIQYQFMTDPLNEGYALAANDTGHTGNGGDFAIGHPEKMVDYAYRADHEMTLKGKEIVAKFYGKAASRSIWIGCSLGGIEALIEAKRYPNDYDAIIAGAPPNPITLFNAEQIWGAWLNLNHPEGTIPREKFTMIHQTVLKQCAGPAGLAQGFIDDPEHCNFKPASLLCKGVDAPDCLTAPQVERLSQLYQGPVDPRNGKVIFPGPAFGAENEASSTNPVGPAVALYQDFVYEDPKWDWKTLDYAASVDKAKQVMDPFLRVNAEDLKEFLQHGKLMLYVGWTEGHNANELATFYKNAIKDAGPKSASNIRLFLNPGMNHCGNGAGCDTFEKLGVIDKWVETGKAPDQILSSKVASGKTIRTRPLCAYPAVAKYSGSGSLDDAASFTCAVPAAAN